MDSHCLIQNISEILLINKTKKKTIIKEKQTNKGKDKKTIVDKDNNLSFPLSLIVTWNKRKNVI